MSDENAIELARREERLFGLKLNLDGLNQEIAYNFYPERADFTVQRWLGTEFAIDLFDSAPVLNRRDLGNARAAMLRPRGQQWFKAALADDRLNRRRDIAQRLDWLNKRARALMYQAKTGFVRAEKEADHDLVTFGSAVKTWEASRGDDGRQQLLGRCWHLRDMVWLDDADGVSQDFAARRFKASARHIKQKFPDAKLAEAIVQSLDKEPDREFRLCHVMMRASEYDWQKKPRGNRGAPWASIYYDSEHKMLLRERPSQRFRYCIDRWSTVSGFQYGLSPAAIASLSDARGLQTMKRLILEAGELAIAPPMKAAQGAIKGALDFSANSIVWVDKDYDEKTGPAIEPVFPQAIKLNLGIELLQDVKAALKDAWYLTKLSLPQQAKTAYETAQLVEEFIRANIPLFEPWEAGTERDLDEIFGVLMDIGAFGPMQDWPQELSAAEIGWEFSNPLQDAVEKNKVNQAQQALGIGAGAAQLDPNSRRAVDWVKVTADAVRGSGAPADWVRDDGVVTQEVAQAQQQQNVAGGVLGALNTAGQAADVVNTGADAAQKLGDLFSGSQPANGEGVYGPT